MPHLEHNQSPFSPIKPPRTQEGQRYLSGPGKVLSCMVTSCYASSFVTLGHVQLVQVASCCTADVRVVLLTKLNDGIRLLNGVGSPSTSHFISSSPDTKFFTTSTQYQDYLLTHHLLTSPPVMGKQCTYNNYEDFGA